VSRVPVALPASLTSAQTRPNEAEGQGSEIKKGTYLYQPISTLSVETVQEVIQLISCAPRLSL
jgi:hypothetical protein